MTPKQEAALRLALDCVSTLANARDWVGCTPNERWDEDEMYAELCNATICLKKSLSIIQEALAKQPAQQEPVATLDDIQQEIYENTREFVSLNVMEWMLKRYYTPPASKPEDK